MARPKDPELEKQRKHQIADAAIALLSEKPWQSVTQQSVAERAGVSKGVVTYWFADKDQLMLAAIRRFHSRYEDRLMAIAAENLPIKFRLRRLIEAAFPDRATLVDEARFQAELWSYAKGRPDVEAEIANVYAAFRMATRALIELGAAEGYITTPDRDDLHLYVHALVDGLSLHLAFDPEVDVVEKREKLLVMMEKWFT